MNYEEFIKRDIKISEKAEKYFADVEAIKERRKAFFTKLAEAKTCH